jgi:hypothetical protein
MFDIITCSKQKLAIRETKTATNIQEVAETDPSTPTTISRQPSHVTCC